MNNELRITKINEQLFYSLPVLTSADNLYRQFGPRSGQTKRRA